MSENMMNPANKTNNSKGDIYRINYEKIFRKKKRKKKTSKDRITKKEIDEIKKEYLNKSIIGSDPPEAVVISTTTAESIIRSRKRHEEWLDSIHESHDMTHWYSEIKAPAGTERFYKVRKCKNCEYEQYEHSAGQFIDGPLTSECEESYEINSNSRRSI